MNISSLFSLFQSFIPGPRLIDGGELRQLVDLLFSAQSKLVAAAGGGQAGALPLPAAVSEILTAGVGGTDSVELPIGLPGLQRLVVNDSANTIQVFGAASNPNTGVGDTITPHGSITPAATAIGVSQATTILALYVCFAPGQWKQGLLT